ncbi:MAG: nucleotidyltransferase family protein [Thermoplasmatota archaeon]
MGRIVIAREAGEVCSALVGILHEVPRLVAVVLFGSSVDGTFDKRSDIDLLFLFSGRADPERSSMGPVLAILNRAREASGVDRDVTPVLARINGRDLEEGFRRNVANGIVVWARPRLVLGKPSTAGPHVLVTYGVTKLTAAQRSRLQRTLFGHTSRKTVKGKTYTHRAVGLVYDEEHVAPSTLLLPHDRAGPILTALKAAMANVRQRDVYMV